MNLASLLPTEAVLPHLPARDKKQVLKRLAAQAAQFCELPEREIYEVLAEREERGCTGMGNGVCIPHGRFEHLDKLHVLFARLARPIPFDAPDGKPVDLVFLMLTPASANTEHIKTLATISRMLRDKEFCKGLRATDNARALHGMIIARGEDEA